jgi:hypothetical protein
MTSTTRITTLALLSTLALAALATGAQAQDGTAEPAHELAAAAREAYEAAAIGVATGTATPEEVYRWSQRWMQAETARAPGVAATHAKAHLERMQALDATVQQGIASGMSPASAGAAVRYYVAEARAAVEFATPK